MSPEGVIFFILFFYGLRPVICILQYNTLIVLFLIKPVSNNKLDNFFKLSCDYKTIIKLGT